MLRFSEMLNIEFEKVHVDGAFNNRINQFPQESFLLMSFSKGMKYSTLIKNSWLRFWPVNIKAEKNI